MNNPLVRLAVAFGLVGIVAGFVLLLVFNGEVVEELAPEATRAYYTPSELKAMEDKAVERTVRLGGMARPGADPDWRRQLPVRFFIADGDNRYPVEATGVPPAMFKEGIGVIVEGQLGKDGVFRTDRILVKHNNEYRAPDDEHPKPNLTTLEG